MCVYRREYQILVHSPSSDYRACNNSNTVLQQYKFQNDFISQFTRHYYKKTAVIFALGNEIIIAGKQIMIHRYGTSSNECIPINIPCTAFVSQR